MPVAYSKEVREQRIEDRMRQLDGLPPIKKNWWWRVKRKLKRRFSRE
jgi:hypothetical protein